ncbi:hypothetical protein [Helicobacter bizzozeronii]|uniref:hypothetical protein n=1 Tax=Helicobacter bizzozeronii TaxID=56877 RepID=UPI0018F83640|nr:hypothetical protein [Helicobacter bizzozeronii]GMB92988.1 hypothetical protein NHP200010_06990 [Helicobacter bizzozeronii]GMT38388.1 hypothetical protein NHP20013_04550 [Helicobacter bizzozeronii]
MKNVFLSALLALGLVACHQEGSAPKNHPHESQDGAKQHQADGDKPAVQEKSLLQGEK